MTEQHPKTVILELPFGALAGWPVVLDAFRHAREATGYHLTFSGLIDQIERQLPKPKPEEPTGLGAVVEDDEGERYVSANKGPGACWIKSGHGLDGLGWGEVPAVRVVWGGVH